MTGFWELMIRITVLWAVGELAALAVSRRSVRLGYLVHVAVVAGMLAVPLVSVWLPPQIWEVPGWRMAAPAGQGIVDIPVTPVAQRTGPAGPRMHVNALAAVYAAVAALLLLRMVAGGVRLRRMLRASRLEDLPEAAQIARDLGLNACHTAIRSSPRVVIPFTVGVRRPVVLLPEDWRSWPPAKLRSVLAHELAHAAAKDWLAARLAALNRAVYWFHPAAWWLERRLAAAAEECADRTALAVVGDRQSYVETILDFARAVQARRVHGMEATAMARTSRTEKRLEKILSAARFSPEPVRLPALAALLAAALPVVLAAALVVPVPQPQQAQPAAAPQFTMVPSPQAVGSDQEAAELEAALRTQPNDDISRFRLLNYYASRGEISQARTHAMFLIEQRPESPNAVLATMLWAGIAQRGQAAEDIRQLTEIWRRHVAARPESARVLSNAAAVMMRAGMLFDAESLLHRARRLEPSEFSYTAFLANLYANTILGNQSGSEEFLPKVRAELASTPDPLLLAYVAEQLLAYSGLPRPASDGKSLSAQLAEQRIKEAEKYLRRALLLDPENEAAKKVMAIYESRLKQTTEPPGAVPRRITVGRNAQNALLLHKPEPVYPEAARRAGVQGKVVFRAVIGGDGEIKQLQLVSGHPSLVEAARDAVVKYRYRPTLLNGEPVEVETEIEVPFGLPATAPPQAEARLLQDILREGGATAPQPVVRVPLEMTPEARAARAQGAVLLEILVDEEGNVKEAQVRRGFGLGMDEKAVETVLQWKFKPALKDGKPVPVRANVEMKFQAM